MRRFLAYCEEIEQSVADVYRFWQQVYAALWQQVFWQAAAVEAEVEAAAPAAK